MPKVLVVYSTAQQDHRVELEVAPGTTVEQAIALSGLAQREPALVAQPLMVGIWNRKAALDRLVADGDRIEIYRPLTIDPKEGRRLRAALNRKRAEAARKA